jgi:hypothetical protein
MISGCHPTVTPLALPETLPSEITDEVVIALRAELARLLKPFLLPKKAQTTRHFRNQSETGHSATSSNEGASEFRVAYNVWDKKKKKDDASRAAAGDR